jgi:hypothetical protein
MREARMQLLDALHRLESIDHRFQDRSGSGSQIRALLRNGRTDDRFTHIEQPLGLRKPVAIRVEPFCRQAIPVGPAP